MATGSIKKEYKTGSVTASGSVDTSNLVVKQDGNVVVINGFASNVPLNNAQIKIGDLYGVPFPKASVRSLAGCAANAYGHPADVAYLVVGNGGDIQVNSTIVGTRVVYFSVSYIV